jgi:hypothetical protein
VALLTNLSAYWTLDEASGSRADSHGGNTLTDNNTVGSGTGILGTAADFEDGNSESLSCASNPTLQATAAITVTAWVKLESKGSGDVQIVSKDSASGREYTLFYRASSDRFAFSRLDLATDTLANTFGSPSTGVWYFLVGWYDPATGEQGISVNGTADTATATSGRTTGTSSQFQIGARQYSGFEGYFDGLIDEVGFWRGRCLTSTERATLYGAGTPPAYPFSGVAVRSVSTLATGSRTNSTFTAPAGVTDGDWLILVMGVGASSGPPAVTLSGFSAVSGFPGNINKPDPFTVNLVVMAKLASGESGSYTFAHSAATTNGILYCVRNAHQSAPFSPAPTLANGTNTTTTATGLTAEDGPRSSHRVFK